MFLILRILELLTKNPRILYFSKKVGYFLTYSIVSVCLQTNISYISGAHNSKSKCYYNAKPLAYYFLCNDIYLHIYIYFYVTTYKSTFKVICYKVTALLIVNLLTNSAWFFNTFLDVFEQKSIRNTPPPQPLRACYPHIITIKLPPPFLLRQSP